ncbi:hypothetical protein SteCoe_13255 [Stentor coeruleus]|uniref:TFIIS N-terminal domain-containing protein n=1 Tax=Stentor coeruleus TaxID=5963 RepID=A0A1R2C8U2_9CILI|nr:hypothetical protein SteCoe_13255 [Stentor coeruleus]
MSEEDSLPGFSSEEESESSLPKKLPKNHSNSDIEQEEEPQDEEENNEDEQQDDNEDQEDQEDEQQEMFELLMKKKKRPTSHRYEIDEEEDENMIDQLLDSMNKAAESDIQANKDGAPALNKLKMLDKVLKFLKVSKHHELFLGMNGCVVIGKWLSQLPDGSFPSTPLRSGLLQALQDLPISVENLQSSNLGKSVMAIYSNSNETQVIKKLAKNLIDKWSRTIYGINTEYTALHKESNAVETITIPKKKFSLQALINQEQQTNFTKLPERGMFNFKNRPIPEVAANENTHQFNADSTYAKIKKKMQKKKGKSKSKGLMSVDGKGLDY